MQQVKKAHGHLQIIKSCHTNKYKVDLNRHQDVSLFSVPFLNINYVSWGQDMGFPSSESFEGECLQTNSVRTMTKPLPVWFLFRQGSRRGQQAVERTHSSALSTTKSEHNCPDRILPQQRTGRQVIPPPVQQSSDSQS